MEGVEGRVTDVSVEVTDNRAAVRSELAQAVEMALEVIGGTIEDRARDNIQSPRRLMTELRDSLTHDVIDGVLRVGSELEVAAYVELGTGPNYNPPPEWLENMAKGGRGMAGIKQWIYYDPLAKAFKIGTPQEAKPFLRPAFLDHKDEYKRILEDALKGE